MPGTGTPLFKVVEYLRRVGDAPMAAELSDGQLLERFLHDGSDTAFAALVHRHGPMVLGVCRRLLPHVHDAEDAFQATFLVLARKAASILARENVAHWLYGVAYRVAKKARACYWKRRHREKQVAVMPEVAQSTESVWDDVKAVVDEELARLPAAFGRVLVLCDLEGRTQHEAARQLGIPEGTVSSRLMRGRKLLARRLAQRGIAPAVGGAALTLLAQQARASLSYPLAGATVQGVIASLPRGAVSSDGFSQDVLYLAKGASSSMTKKTLLAACCFAAVLTAAWGLTAALAERSSQGTTPPPQAAAQPAGGNGGAKQPDHTTAIVNKAVQALGDPKVQAKYRGITLDMQFKTTANNIDMTFNAAWSALGHDKYRAEVTITDNVGAPKTALFVIDGKNGWSVREQKLEQGPEQEVLPALAVLSAVRLGQKPGDLLGKEFKLSSLGEIQTQGQAAVGLKIERQGFRDVRLYFDKKSGLPLKCEFTFPKIHGSPVDTQFALGFSDYKEVAGVKQFTKMTVYHEQKEVTTVELSNIQLHETLKADLFAKPPQP